MPGKDIEIPLPGEDHKYCMICKDKYEDYLTHLESQAHKVQIGIQDSIYKDIDLLNEELKEQAKKRRSKSQVPSSSNQPVNDGKREADACTYQMSSLVISDLDKLTNAPCVRTICE